MTWPALTVPRFVRTAVDPPVRALEPLDLGVGMDLDAGAVGAARVAPHDRVVADDPARRVVERAHDRIGRRRRRRSAAGTAASTSAASTSCESIPFRRLTSARLAITNIARSECASVRWPHCENSRLKSSSADSRSYMLDAGVVEARALGRLVVRAQDRRVAPRGARADVALLEHGHVADAELAEVVRGRQAVRAAADDHDVVAVAQLAAPAPHPPGPEDLTHRARHRPTRPRRPGHRRGAAASATTSHRYSPERPADEHEQLVLGLAQHVARACARPSPGRKPATGVIAGARRSRRSAPAARARRGPASASAASPQVTSTTVVRRPRPRVTARQRRRPQPGSASTSAGVSPDTTRRRSRARRPGSSATAPAAPTIGASARPPWSSSLRQLRAVGERDRLAQQLALAPGSP